MAKSELIIDEELVYISAGHADNHVTSRIVTGRDFSSSGLSKGVGPLRLNGVIKRISGLGTVNLQYGIPNPSENETVWVGAASMTISSSNELQRVQKTDFSFNSQIRLLITTTSALRVRVLFIG